MSSSTIDCLESLATSNRPPSSQESSVAEECLQPWDQKLRDVDSQIAALEHELEDLKAQRSIIEKERNRYTDMLSARRLLPPEIIGRFMELACVDDTESQSSGAYGQVLSFMLVSREWYRTACGVAHFWNKLSMDLTNSSAEDTQEIILKASNQSERAAELPLSLNIAFSAVLSTNSRVVDFIHSLVPRLEVLALRIQVDSISDLQILDTLFHNPPSSSANALVWPTLHTLQISIQSEPEHLITAESELSFPLASFPLLTTAAISSPNVSFTSYQILWVNLLKLDLGPLPELEPQQYISMLGKCTNLRSLHLHTQHEIDGNQLPVTTLPHLTHLHVKSSDPHDMGRILSSLKLPSLQSCIYTVSHPGYYYYLSIVCRLTELFQRSGCSESMEYLELDLSHGTFSSSRTLSDLLLQVPHLTVLKLSGYKMEEDALKDIPRSVRELSICLSYYRIDDARKAFVNYLNSRFASSDVPVKARLHLVDSAFTVPIRQRIATLKNSVGSPLDVVMD
ncbi:hypothetical protein EST38_g13648 [Candolleomyces aberdarensis]|uniref:F-box domain-containing protein n=1 Tax=Candolleomyces aberdarensis TaxID=2316362 RepID=A0A4Q2D242_9AGAR|nr:hypothetical protein EST38_g13648 [Candolleomyces aberdarensis]